MAFTLCTVEIHNGMDVMYSMSLHLVKFRESRTQSFMFCSRAIYLSVGVVAEVCSYVQCSWDLMQYAVRVQCTCVRIGSLHE